MVGKDWTEIILEGGSLDEPTDLEARCKGWTGREIKIISDFEARANLEAVRTLNLGIP